MHVGLLLVAGISYTAARTISRLENVQAPLSEANLPVGNDNTYGDRVIKALTEAEIIPQVVNTFEPLGNFSAGWTNASTRLGNTVEPELMQSKPNTFLTFYPSSNYPGGPGNSFIRQFVFVLTDPDAKSRDNPIWAEFCHWISYFKLSIPLESPVPLSLTLEPSYESKGARWEEVVEYKPPSPPPGMGKHRYVLLALTPSNRTREPLYLRKPSGRQRWGNDKERTGVRQWAEEHELDVIAANFVYSENAEQ